MQQKQPLHWCGHLPIPSHSTSKIITSPFSLHKDDGLVFLLTHDFFKQTDKPTDTSFSSEQINKKTPFHFYLPTMMWSKY